MSSANADATESKAAFSEALDLFRIVQTDDEGPGEMGDELGVGVSFPDSGVYVDWNTGAWPEDERLDGPHVSEYDTVEDAATVAQGEIEHLTTTAGDGTMLPMPADAQLLYPDEGQAEAAAQDLGLPPESSHPHDLDGEEWHMPGESHQQFEDVVGADTDQEGEKLDECAESVLEDNPDLSESEAYAICNAELDAETDSTAGLHDDWESRLTQQDDPCWEGYTMVGLQDNGTPRCVPEEDVDNYEPEADTGAATGVGSKAEYDTFEEGAAVRWRWDGEPVHGRVAERRPEQATVSGNTITGEEGEPVYVIDEWDDRVGAFRRENVAKPASSLNESGKDLPPRSEGNYVSEEAWESLVTSVSQSAFTPRELDYAARELGILRKSRPGEWLLADDDPVVYQADIPEKYLDGRSEDFFVPNAEVAESARKVREWNEEHPDEFEAGGSDGELLRRAGQLVEYHERGEPLAIEYWQEIRAFHERKHAQDAHELDSEYEGEPWKDDGYAGHEGWGGDAGYEQAKRVMDVVESVDQEAAVEMRGAVATEQSLDPRTLTKADSNEVDLDALEDELREAVEAEDFYIYGKASIEQWDSDDPPTYIQMDALENALDRYFDSETAPGIISRHHQDIPVGRPVRSFEFESDTTLEIDGDQYEFREGDEVTSHVEDADGDGRPELWLAANIDNETEMGKKTRVLAAQGDLNGFSVTVHRNKDELTQEGRYVTDCDLHAVTIGTDDQIKNEGSEFDVASVSSAAQRIKKTLLGVLQPG